MKNHNDEMTTKQVIDMIRRKIKEFGSQEAAAAAWKMSESYLSEQLSGKKPIGDKLMEVLDIEHIDKYRFRKK
jgi:hypothetical protein